MDIRKLKNPTIKDSSFIYVGKEYTVKAGKAEQFPGEVVAFYLQHVNGPLVEPEDITPEVKEEEPKVEKK